ncbi:hypothetical protein ACJ2A9_22360 [Anaerobacillus sp. MEB173]|uniref:hypothetical protein n=1 Tax=Anaerobacillus sp. MEB173 TaxID=3383345 RepID=UPI003F911F81
MNLSILEQSPITPGKIAQQVRIGRVSGGLAEATIVFSANLLPKSSHHPYFKLV